MGSGTTLPLRDGEIDESIKGSATWISERRQQTLGQHVRKQRNCGKQQRISDIQDYLSTSNTGTWPISEEK